MRLARRASALAVAVLLAAGAALPEADAGRIWQHCNQAGFRYAQTEQELNRVAWLNEVRCTRGRCRWKTWLNDWACEVVDEGGVARQGGSG